MTDERSRLARLEEFRADTERRLEDVENEQTAIRGLELTVVGLQRDQVHLREAFEREAEQAGHERDVARRFRREVRENFDRGHDAHERGLTLKDLAKLALSLATAIGIPLATAYMLAPK